MFGEIVDMISDNHQITDFEFRIGASTGIGHKQCFDTQFTHHAYRESHFFHRVTFVVMEASLHCHNLFITQFTENKLTAVPFYGRHRKVGDIFVLYFILFGNFVCQTAKSGSQNDCCFRTCVHLSFQEGCRFLYFL